MPKKSSFIGSRLPEALRERLDAIIHRFGPNDSIILENLLPAFCTAVEQADALRWPVTVLLAEKRALQTVDPQAPYLTKPEAKRGARAVARRGEAKDADARAHAVVRREAVEAAAKNRPAAPAGPKGRSKAKTSPS